MSQETKEAIPYCNILLTFSQQSTFSDKKGIFYIENLTPKDSILISHVNYLTVKMPFESYQDDTIEVFLENRENLLQEVVVAQKTKHMTLGITQKTGKWRSNVYNFKVGQELAFLIPNIDLLEAILEKVSIVVDNNGKTEAPFRVHIYSRDENTGLPKEDLLIPSIITQAKARGGWHHVDLSFAQIDLPKNGLFVGIEWIKTEASYYHESEGVQSEYYGMNLGISTNEPQNYCFLKRDSQGWISGERPFNDAKSRFMNPAIYATFRVYD